MFTDNEAGFCSSVMARNPKFLLFFPFIVSFLFTFLFTSRGLSCLSWRAGLSLVGVIGAIKLNRSQVEHHCLLDIVHYRQTITVAKNNTGGGRSDRVRQEMRPRENMVMSFDLVFRAKNTEVKA